MNGWWMLGVIAIITIYYLATTAILARWLGREIDALSRRIDRIVAIRQLDEPADHAHSEP